MLTDGKQIAAARQLLGWSQADLAEKAGVSKPSIIRMEKDLYSVKDDSRKSVEQAFDNHNVEFIDGGTRINQKIVTIIEGDDCYLKLLNDVEKELKGTDQYMFLSGADETRSSNEVTQKTKEMLKKGILMRFLIRENDTHIMGNIQQYRWMEEQLFIDSDVKVIYANKTAYLVYRANKPQIIIIDDINIAEENKRMFLFIWKMSKIPSHTTATEFY